jgi:hypothetical protein
MLGLVATVGNMARPTPVQVVQILVLSVAFFLVFTVVTGLLIVAFTVVAGMWADRPAGS